MENITLSADGLFAERYRLERRIGKGGMGEVYLVSDTMFDDEKVALKVLRSEFSTDEKHTQRFLREVQLTRKVTHTNIIRTFDVGVRDNKLYFTMEYVEGKTLTERIKAGPTHADEAVPILMQVCEGLAAIHELDIVHRDLKPGNVMETVDGIVKIADFGVARPGVSELTSHDEIVGSSHYMAPEVWVGRDVAAPADIYALGVLAYELVTGCVPFDGENPAELMWKHLEEEPVQPAELAIEIPDWLNQLILVLLEKDQHKRPMCALEVRDFMRRYYTGEGVVEDIDVFEPTAVEELSVSAEDPNQEEATGEYDLVNPLSSESLLTAPTVELTDSFNAKELLETQELDPNVARMKRESGMYRAPSSGYQQTDSDPLDQASSKTWILRFATAIGAPLLLALLIALPGQALLKYLWSELHVGSSSVVLYFYACAVLLLGSALYSLPVFSLSLLRYPVQQSMGLWAKGIAAIFFLMMTIVVYRSFTFSQFASELGIPFHAKHVISSARVTASTGLQAAFLAPVGDTYSLAKVKGAPFFARNVIGTEGKFSAFHILLIGYALFLFVFITRELLPFRSARARRASQLIGVTLIAILTLQCVVEPSVSLWMGWGMEEAFRVRLGTFPVSVSESGLFWGVVNWLTLAVCVVALPAIFRPKVSSSQDSSS